MIRRAHYRISPQHATPAELNPARTIDIDLREVATCAVREILQSRLSGTALNAFFEELLAPDTGWLKWRDEGPGRGRELKRGFSSLFGRFFGRWYLTRHHGDRYFFPIDGSPCIVSDNLVVRRTPGQDLPDWFIAGSGSIGLGEAKGSYIKHAKGVRSSPPLKLAEKQLEGAEVWARAKRNSAMAVRSVKGWGVMLRWTTEKDRLNPLLFVIDPETRGDPLPPEDRDRLIEDIVQLQSLMFLNALGITKFNDRFERITPDRRDELLQSITLDGTMPDDGTTPEEVSVTEFPDQERVPAELARIGAPDIGKIEFVGAIIDGAGDVIPLSVSELFATRSSMPVEVRDRLFFVGVEKGQITPDLSRSVPPFRTIDIDGGRWASVGADGLVVAPFASISDVSKI